MTQKHDVNKLVYALSAVLNNNSVFNLFRVPSDPDDILKELEKEPFNPDDHEVFATADIYYKASDYCEQMAVDNLGFGDDVLVIRYLLMKIALQHIDREEVIHYVKESLNDHEYALNPQ